MVRTWRKLVWVFEFWNEMLVSNIRCKNLSKRSSFRKFFFTRILKREGWKLMTCHLFLDNFSWNFMTFELFQRLRVLKQIFVSREVKYHSFDIMKRLSFLNLSFAKDTLLQNFDCVFVLAIRGLLHMTKNFVLWCDFVF